MSNLCTPRSGEVAPRRDDSQLGRRAFSRCRRGRIRSPAVSGSETREFSGASTETGSCSICGRSCPRKTRSCSALCGIRWARRSRALPSRRRLRPVTVPGIAKVGTRRRIELPVPLVKRRQLMAQIAQRLQIVRLLGCRDAALQLAHEIVEAFLLEPDQGAPGITIDLPGILRWGLLQPFQERFGMIGDGVVETGDDHFRRHAQRDFRVLEDAQQLAIARIAENLHRNQGQHVLADVPVT